MAPAAILLPARSGDREREGDLVGEVALGASVVKSGGSGGRRRGEETRLRGETRRRGLDGAAKVLLTVCGRTVCSMCSGGRSLHRPSKAVV